MTKDSRSDARKEWDTFVSVLPYTGSDREDEAWCRFKALHGFIPKDFERKPPWCEAGAENNSWAKQAFLGSVHRERAWSVAGYLERPFHFAYLWLDYAGFSGLRGGGVSLPYTAKHTSAEMAKEATRLARAVERLNADLGRWPFRDALSLKTLVRANDYTNSITLPSSTRFTKEQRHLGARVMLEGARQELLLPLAGPHSVLGRAVEILQKWVPPETLIDRPRRPGALPRLATRWLDKSIKSAGDRDMPSTARYVLIAELVQVLGELGKWTEDAWTEERVRRCLDGKSSRSD
jgi:hypothetical protein